MLTAQDQGLQFKYGSCNPGLAAVLINVAETFQTKQAHILTKEIRKVLEQETY